MSFLSDLFKSDPWRQIERKAKQSKALFELQLKDFVATLAPDLLELIYAVVAAELMKRGQK